MKQSLIDRARRATFLSSLGCIVSAMMANFCAVAKWGHR
jgi:hypothetical protein